jgi:hypothetical protein
VQLKIDALKEAAVWPGAGPAHPRRARHQLMAVELYQEGHPARKTVRRARAGQRKENAMNTRSPYPDGPGRPGYRYPAAGSRRSRRDGVSLMGPADPGTATPLMLPSR